MLMLEEYKNKPVLIIGYGREGRTLFDLLTEAGANVIVHDDKNFEPETIPAALAHLSNIHKFKTIFVSPSVKPTHPIFHMAAETFTPITTSTNLFLETKADKTIAVTGSKGKSTTASLIAHILKTMNYDVAFGGNIGTPLLSLPEAKIYVAELSSYQNKYVTKSPKTIVVTSLFPDHLDYHGNENNYYNDKLNLLQHNPQNIIVNHEDSNLVEQLNKRSIQTVDNPYHIGEEVHSNWLWYQNQKIFNLVFTELRGAHNYSNLKLALNAVEKHINKQIPVHILIEALETFTPLPHRMESIEDPYRQHIFVDDTLATTPQATSATLKTVYKQNPDLKVVLILGGQDRNLPDYKSLQETVTPETFIITLPNNGETILEQLPQIQNSYHAETLDEAVQYVRKHFKQITIVVLSPSAPSYDTHANYEEKSADFKQAIERRLKE